MAYGTRSDPLLDLALVAGIGALAVCALMLAAVVLLRLRLVLERRREQRLVQLWQPILVRCLESVPVDLPSLAPADRGPFLKLWNHYHESLRGPAGERLGELAVRLDMGRVARDMLEAGSLRKRLLGIITLGNLRDTATLAALRALVENPSVLLSLTAAHALLRIDPPGTLAWLLPLAAGRVDWPVARLATMLAEAGAEEVSAPLASAIRRAAASDGAAQQVPRLLKLARLAHTEQLTVSIRGVLDGTTNDEVIAACIAGLSDPRDVETVRRHARHPSWFVRVAAAKALGKLAAPEDRQLLTDMLRDPEWWVRYRSAQALAGLPFMRLEELRGIRGALQDREAAQMLDHVIAELA